MSLASRLVARFLAKLPLAACLLCSGGELGAATFDAGSLSFLPLRYYSGDEVYLRVRVVPEKGERLSELDLKPGSGLPVQAEEADPELRELKLSKVSGAWLLELRFLPWSPGRGALPELRREGFRLPSLPYAALSLLGPEDRDPGSPRPQRQLPGAAALFYGLAGAFVLAFLLALLVALNLVPAARALIARRRAALAFKRLEKSIDFLLREAGGAEAAAFLAALLRALRLYLAARFLPAAPALTAAELAALPEESFPAPATKARTAALVALADRRRFGWAGAEAGAGTGARAGLGAGTGASRALLESAAEEARAIGAANEEVLLARL